MRHRPNTNGPRTAGKAGAALAAIAVGAALITSCSSGGDDAAETSSTLAAEGLSAEAQIKQVTQDWLDARNAGKLSEILPLVCEQVAATAPTDLPDQGAEATQGQIDSFGEIKVDGDSATTTLTFSAIDDPSVPDEPVPMEYKNEDGWKMCPSQPEQ